MIFRFTLSITLCVKKPSNREREPEGTFLKSATEMKQRDKRSSTSAQMKVGGKRNSSHNKKNRSTAFKWPVAISLPYSTLDVASPLLPASDFLIDPCRSTRRRKRLPRLLRKHIRRLSPPSSHL